MTRKIRVGLFFSQSPSFPQAETNLTDGVRAGLAPAPGGETLFEVLGYPADTNSRRLTATISRAFTVDRVDVAVTNVGYAVLHKLAQGLALYKKPVFVISSGADGVRNNELFPFIFRSSMLYWESAWAAGRWAGTQHGGRVLLVTTMLDCCYDSHSAFLEGVKAAGGTAPLPCVCDAPDYNYHGERLIDAIRRERPDLLAVFACGSNAANIVETISGDAQAASLPVVYGPLLHEEPLASNIGPALARGPSFFSWSDDLLNADTAACRDFKERWGSVSPAKPDFFSIFGYETALFIRKSYESNRANESDKSAVIRSIEGSTITSPRGEIIMDARLHTTNGGIYFRKMVTNVALTSHSSTDFSECGYPEKPDENAVFGDHQNRWLTDYLQS